MSRRRQSVGALALALVLVVAPAVGFVGGVAAAATPTVTIDAPDAVTNGNATDASLVVTGVGDADDVGSFEVGIAYDGGDLSIDASGSDEFTVETSSSGSGSLTVVGYTGSLDTDGGTLVLANLTITGESVVDATDLDVSVESLSDTDGNALPVKSSGTSVAVEAADSTDATDDTDDTDDTDGSTTGPSGSTGPVGTVAPGPSVAASESVALTDADPDTPGTTIRFRNVSVSDITFQNEVTGGNVTVKDLGSTLPEDAQSAPGSENVVRAVDISVPDEANGPATIRMRVSTADLGETAPEDARIGRLVDGSWQFLETRVVSTNGDVVLEADAPGFSVFAVFRGSQSTATPFPTRTVGAGGTASPTATEVPAATTVADTESPTPGPTAGVETTGATTDTTSRVDETTTSPTAGTPATPPGGGGIDLVVIVVVLAIVGAAALLGLRRYGKL